jgi:GNAT superfamily N-acetyltransferase
MTTAEACADQQQVTLDDGETIDIWSHDEYGHVTVTAWAADGAPVGVAWFRTGNPGHPAEASVEVTPSHRSRGIGSLLLRQLIDEASARGIRWLTWTGAADDPHATSLPKASHAICARRVAGGRATSAILVPAA